MKAVADSSCIYKSLDSALVPPGGLYGFWVKRSAVDLREFLHGKHTGHLVVPVVEARGVEPLTSGLQSQRSPS